MRHEGFEHASPVTIPGVPEMPRATTRTSRIARAADAIRERLFQSAKRRRLAREYRAMRVLSDRLLRDVGVNRYEITEARLRALLAETQGTDAGR